MWSSVWGHVTKRESLYNPSTTCCLTYQKDLDNLTFSYSAQIALDLFLGWGSTDDRSHIKRRRGQVSVCT